MSENSLDLYRQARDLMDKNQLEEAILIFEESIKLVSHFKTLELLGECYIRSNHFQKAIVPLAASVTLNKGVRAATLLANGFLKLEDYKSAKYIAEIALSRDSNNKVAKDVMRMIENA